MRIAIFGANGPTGRLLTRQAVGEGHSAVVFTRHPDAFPLEHPLVTVVGGEVADAAAVGKAVTGCDAVISTLGAPFGRKPVDVYSTGARHILAAMAVLGVERLVAVSSTAIDPGPGPIGGWMFRHVAQPMVMRMGRTVYEDQRRMETIVTASGAAWTLVRPSGLFVAGRRSDYDVSDRYATGRFTAREDLADCLLREVTGPGHPGRPVAVTTTEGLPSLPGVIWREGIRKNR